MRRLFVLVVLTGNLFVSLRLRESHGLVVMTVRSGLAGDLVRLILREIEFLGRGGWAGETLALRRFYVSIFLDLNTLLVKDLIKATVK